MSGIKFGDGWIGAQALERVLPQVKQQQQAAGGVIVLRPDSGDPLEAVMMGLRAGTPCLPSLPGLGFRV